MKPAIKKSCFLLCFQRIASLATLFSMGVPAAHAGLTLEMNVIRYDPQGYYFFPNLTTNSTAPSVPFGDYYITSSGVPTNGSSAFYHFDANGFNQNGGLSWGYGDFASMIHELTNGNWTIFVTNTVTTNVYHFTVTANISSNSLPLVAITFPPNGATDVTNQPTFTWQGPANYSNLVVYYFNGGETLPVTQTSLPSPRLLYQGINSVTVHYDSYSTTGVVSSIPLDGSSHPISSWVSTTHFQDYLDSQFTVGTVDTSGTSHTLVAHYAWDDTNEDGTASGADTSGNGYDINFGGGYGGEGGVDSTIDSETGARAIQFHDGDGSSAGYVGWNPTPSGLLNALSGSFSISCWIKTSQNYNGWDQSPAYYGAGIISADIDGLANDVIPLALTGSKIGFNTGGDEDVTLNSSASVNDGNYHHIVVTRNQATGQKIIYIDGVLDSFSSGTTNPLNDPQLLTIGALSDAGNSDASDANYYNGYDGELDDVQIYSGVLSAGDVANLHANPGSTVANGGGTGSGGHSIVARYDFEETNSPGVDTSGHGNDSNCGGGDGTENNNDTYSTDAAVGIYSRDFLGHTFICFASPADPFSHLANAFSGSFSVSAWVKTTQAYNGDDDPADFGASLLFADGANTNSTIPLALTGSKVAISVNDHNGNKTTLHSQTSVNDGQYHQIAVTRNQADGVLKVYVDGNLDGTANGPADRLYISSIIALGGYFNDFTGLLDDVQIYSGVLSDTDVASLYANPGTTVPDVAGGSGGAVVHYDFDEGTVLAADVSGNYNNMVHAGNFDGDGPSISTDTAAGAGSVSFDGGSYLTAPSSLLPTLASSFSVSLWLKTSQSYGNQNDVAWTGAGVISADSPNDGARDLIPVALTGGQVAFNVGDGNFDDTLNSSATVNDGNWHHVVVTRNQSTGDRQIFIDGTLDSSAGGTTELLNDPVLLTIGAKSDASNSDPASPDYNGSNGYEGLLDDVQIYNRVLSVTEVTYLHDNPGAVIAGSSGSVFATALNTTNLTWVSGGDSPWFTETSIALDGLAAQSGPITDDQSSYLETTIPADGQLSFNWKVLSEDGYDLLTFYINGNEQDAISGDVDWNQEVYSVSAGDVLRWEYSKDGSDSVAPDAGFLDEISYVSGPLNTNSAPIITVNPFSQTNYPGYSVALLAAATSNPAATWQWFKVGTGLIVNATNTLFIPTNSGTAGVVGSYYAVASNFLGSAITLTAVVTFASAPLPPDWSQAFNEQLYNNFNDDTTNYNIACLIDSTGTNIYTVGSIVGTNTFGSDTLISGNGVFGSSFLKQTATGTPIWGRCMTNNGNGSSYAQCVVTAPGDGFYVSGNIFGTNWLGTNKLVDVGGGSTYLARFDANGSNVWIRTITGTNANFTTYHMLASDPAGNVTLSTLISGYTSIGTTNVFVDGQKGVLVQYDANGNVRWLQLPSSWPNYLTYNAGRIYGSMGGSDNNYIGGVTNVSDRKQALYSINATNGQGLWVRGVGAAQGQNSPYGFGDDSTLVAVSGTNVFITGSAYGSNAVFGAYTVALPTTGRGQYFARYDTNGNAQLATSFGSQYTWPWAAVADASGNVYVGGDFDTYSTFGDKVIAAPFYDTVQFVGTTDIRIPGQVFVAKFDRNGNPLWARLAASQSSYLNSRDIALASDGIWSCGLFSQPSVFGSITISGSITVVGSPFGYLVYHPSGYLAKIIDGAAAASPVTLLNPKPVGANFQFQFQSLSGFSHNILYRTNLATGTWLTNSTISGDGTLKTISLPFSVFSPAKQGFIRVSTQ